MILSDAKALFLEYIIEAIDSLSRRAINDATVPGMIPKILDDVRSFILLLLYGKIEIRAVEAGNKELFILKAETVLDIPLHADGRCRCESGNDRTLRKI